MKKKIGFLLVSLAAFVVAINTTSALTEYTADSWTSGNGYGSVTEVDDNITNIKGETTASGGVYVGPFNKASTAKLEDEGGIVEELYVGLDPAKIAAGEYFEVSLALKNAADEYVSEAVVMTQRVGDEFKVTAGWAPDFSAVVTAKGVYTYTWEAFVEGEKTYVVFTLLQGNTEIATTGKIDFDTIVTADTKNPIKDQEDVSVKYLWFCNVNVANGVDVYTELPTVNITFVDPTSEEEDLVLEVFQYMAFTEEEAETFITELKESAAEEGINFEGFYLDEEYTEEFDLTKPFEEDVTVYLKISELEGTPEPEEENPKTSDINLALLLGTIVVGAAGLVLVSKKRFN